MATAVTSSPLRVRSAHLVVLLAGMTAAAWLAMAVTGHLASRGSMQATHHHMHGVGTTGSLPASVAGFALMTVAMMTIGLLPLLRYVRTRTLRRRWWSVPTVVAAYFAVWLLVGLVALSLTGRVELSPVAVVALLLVAAAWQLTPMKRWAMTSCERTTALRLSGRRATQSELRFGAHQGAWCVMSCWAVMLPMALGAQPAVPLMIAGTTVVTTERLTSRPARARLVGAAILAASAATLAAAHFAIT
jgi:predicted metal-binding membrane protein